MTASLEPIVFDTDVYKLAMSYLDMDTEMSCSPFRGCCSSIITACDVLSYMTSHKLHLGLLSALVKPPEAYPYYWWEIGPEVEKFEENTPRIIALQLAIEAVLDMPKTIYESHKKGFYRLGIVLWCLDRTDFYYNSHGLCSCITKAVDKISEELFLPYLSQPWRKYQETAISVFELFKGKCSKYRTIPRDTKKSEDSEYWWPLGRVKDSFRRRVLEELACWAYIEDIRNPL